MRPSVLPFRAAVQLYLWPNGVADGDPDVVVDSNGERWLMLPEGPSLWYGPLDRAYAEEAELAHCEAYDLSGGAPS